MRSVTLRVVDVAAAVTWAVCGAFADVGALRVWAGAAASVAALVTTIAWLSRRLDRLESHVYTEGMRAGFDAKQQLVKLPQR